MRPTLVVVGHRCRWPVCYCAVNALFRPLATCTAICVGTYLSNLVPFRKHARARVTRGASFTTGLRGSGSTPQQAACYLEINCQPWPSNTTNHPRHPHNSLVRASDGGEGGVEIQAHAMQHPNNTRSPRRPTTRSTQSFD